MKLLSLFVLLFTALLPLAASEEAVTWLVQYEGKALPAAPWAVFGIPKASLNGAALQLTDDSQSEAGAFEAEWGGELSGKEIVVEARVKVVSMVGYRNSPVAVWPQRDGAPISVEVCDGSHQEGLLLTPPAYTDPGMAEGYVRTLTDRFYQANTTAAFHTYRLVIRGTDMAVEMDGKRVIQGQGAFWRPAESPRRFLRFGSSSKSLVSVSEWEFVRLGVRAASVSETVKSELKVTVGAPFDLPEEKRSNESRPYLYNMGQGLLLMSAPQGSDALLEPYCVRRSTDEGKTWQKVPGLDQNAESPQEMVRLADGRILGPSRWTWLQPDGSLRGKTTILDSKAEGFEAHDSVIHLPEAFQLQEREVLMFERHAWAEPDGSVTAVGWTRKSIKLANKRNFPERRSHLLRSTDLGKTWEYLSHIGLGGEPAVVRLNATEWLAVTRPDAHMSNLLQFRSLDAGRTWVQEAVLEEGSVDPDLELMSNGVLACSYGRPASNIMFSVDGGRHWTDHHVVSDRVSFNYTGIREISPGRLLFIHDGAQPGGRSRINSFYIDVERIKR